MSDTKIKIDKTVGHVKISLNCHASLAEAQAWLNRQIVADCDSLIPFQQGALRNSVRFPEGVYGGQITYNTPYAHYQYAGTVYGPNIPIKDADGNLTGWYSPPKKYPTSRKLQYHTPGTHAQWFEEAKRRHLQEWVKGAQKRVET